MRGKRPASLLPATDTTYLSPLDDSKDLSTWERGAPLRNACLSFWSVKAELGLRVPGREGPVFFKIWYNAFGRVGKILNLRVALRRFAIIRITIRSRRCSW